MIYDCFIFNREVELLEIRLNTYYNIVDKFVLVEATKTFSGIEKNLYTECLDLTPFKDKLIHIIVSDFSNFKNRWEREYYQRNQIINGLSNCNNDDIILLSDVDEFPKIPGTLSSIPESFEQDLFWFYLNTKILIEHWYGTVKMSFEYFKKETPQYWRNQREHLPRIKNGGHHFSWLGGTNKIIQKIKDYSHGEYDNEEGYTLFLNKKQSEFDNLSKTVDIVDINYNNFPAYLVNNQLKYKHLIKSETNE